MTIALGIICIIAGGTLAALALVRVGKGDEHKNL